MISRKTFLALLTGVAAAALSAGAASAQTVKIGLINSNSGFLAQAGDQMDKGISLYIKEHTKDLPPGAHFEYEFDRTDWFLHYPPEVNAHLTTQAQHSRRRGFRTIKDATKDLNGFQADSSRPAWPTHFHSTQYQTPIKPE